MRKAKAKQDGKIRRFFKYLTKNITNIFKILLLVIMSVVMAIEVILVLYGLKMGATIKIDCKEGWLPTIEVITPTQEYTRPTALGSATEQPTVMKKLYNEEIKKRKKSEEALKEYLGKSILISRLPLEVQGSPDEVITKTSEVVRKLSQYCQSFWYCCSVIGGELSQKLSIDTNLHSEDNHTKEVYLCMQRFLNTLGHYYGSMDGDQGRTKAALEDFQRAKNLMVDGKLGRQTWNAMICEVGQEILGDVPQE